MNDMEELISELTDIYNKDNSNLEEKIAAFRRILTAAIEKRVKIDNEEIKKAIVAAAVPKGKKDSTNMSDREKSILEATDINRDKQSLSIQDEKKAAIKRILAHAMKNGVSIDRLEEMKKMMVVSPIKPKEKDDKEDGKSTTAFCQGGKISLLYDEKSDIRVDDIEHELRHLVIPGYGGLQEGIISMYSNDKNSGYKTQIDIAKKLETAVGGEFLAKEAYENGFDGLKERLDHLCGYNAYEQFIDINNSILETEGSALDTLVSAIDSKDEESVSIALKDKAFSEVYAKIGTFIIDTLLEDVNKGKFCEEINNPLWYYLTSFKTVSSLNSRYQLLEEISGVADKKLQPKIDHIKYLVQTAALFSEEKRTIDNQRFFQDFPESEKQIYLPMADALQDKLIESKYDSKLDEFKRYAIHELHMKKPEADEGRAFLILDKANNELDIFSTQKPHKDTRYAFKSYSVYNKGQTEIDDEIEEGCINLEEALGHNYRDSNLTSFSFGKYELVVSQDSQTNEFNIFQVEELPSQYKVKCKLSKVELGKQVNIFKLLAYGPKKNHNTQKDSSVQKLRELNDLSIGTNCDNKSF